MNREECSMENTQQETVNKNVKVGIVTSNAMEKTVVVSVDRIMTHPAFKKIIRRTKKFMAHDEVNACNVGDRVKIMECRPLSRRKCWRVVEILEKAK